MTTSKLTQIKQIEETIAKAQEDLAQLRAAEEKLSAVTKIREDKVIEMFKAFKGM